MILAKAGELKEKFCDGPSVEAAWRVCGRSGHNRSSDPQALLVSARRRSLGWASRSSGSFFRHSAPFCSLIFEAHRRLPADEHALRFNCRGHAHHVREVSLSVALRVDYLDRPNHLPRPQRSDSSLFAARRLRL